MIYLFLLLLGCTENEQLPTHLGWTPRYPAYDLASLGALMKRVEEALPADIVRQEGGHREGGRAGDIHSMAVQEVMEEL